MSAIINGPLEIVTIGGSGTVNFGGSAVLSPKTALKTFTGSGGFSTGVILVTVNGLSGTNIVNSKLMDQPTVGNN